jgi:hypothetical protein
MSVSTELMDCQAVSTFKTILTIHKQVLSICESLSAVIAKLVATPAGRDHCIEEKIIDNLVDALKTHPASKPLLDAVTLVVTYFTATAAGTAACIAAGAAGALERAYLTQTPLSFLLPA